MERKLKNLYCMLLIGGFSIALCALPSIKVHAKMAGTGLGLKPYHASYIIYWNGLQVGNSVHSLKKIDPHFYLATSVSKPFMTFLPFNSYDTSEFFISNRHIFPSNYDYQSQEKKRQKSGTLIFDWKLKKGERLKVKPKKITEHFALPDQAQDKITVFFQLRQDLLAGKKSLNYTVVEPDRIKTYQFKITGTETLKTALGTFETLRLEHLSDNRERLTKFWLAKDLDYLMVKLQQYRKGKITAETRIQKLEH